MNRARSPVWIPAEAPCKFPDPREFAESGLVAGGGDLSVDRLLAAYRAGIFPWYDEPPILWWSPDPRAVITPQTLHVSRSLKRRLESGVYTVTCNRAPEAVLDGCADRNQGSWLNADMKAAYLALFGAGHMLSFEAWASADTGMPRLVGGLYGVLVGGLFAAESKFHRETDASKVALVCAVRSLFKRGLRLFDVQFTTEHLMSLGVFDIPRAAYLEQLSEAQGTSAQAPSSAVDDLVLEALNQA